VLAGTMLALLLDPRAGTATRRLAGVALAGTVPLGGVLGLTMLLAGRGPLGATTERLLLVVAVSWLTGTAVLTVLRNSVIAEAWISPPSMTGSPRSSGGSPS
jgi:hypothetical protein